MKSRKHPHLYEIPAWSWLEELGARERKNINLGSVPESEWDRLKSLGFDFVWLMGVWKRSPIGRRLMRTDPAQFLDYDAALPGWTLDDVVGSPYSVEDYAPDPRMGTWADLDAVRDRLHARGMKLILDFVTNHTGLDHPWIAAQPQYYIQGELTDFRRNPPAFFLSENGGATRLIARGKDPYFPPWPDTAQINYFNPEAREAVLGVLRAIASHCDGVRCDMAMLCLNDVFARTWGPLLSGFTAPRDEFWTGAVSALPGFVWLGEVYWDLEWRMQQLGMTFTYDKRLYDKLRSDSAGEVRDHLKADVAYQSRLARFLENHDEARSAAVFGPEKLPAAATIVATLPGLRFYHHGQLSGKKLHLPIPLARAAPEPPNGQIQALYQKLLEITRDDAFHSGEWELLETCPGGDPTFDNLIAYRWRAGAALKIVAVNLSGTPARGNIRLDGALKNLFDDSRSYVFHDQLSDRSYEWAGADLDRTGLFVRLDAHQSHIFDVQPQ
ncbi:MAG: alpha-amylase family glycosyl hydrolase [Terriglobia bacterium]